MITQIKKTVTLSIVFATLFSCGKNNGKADGYGNFEATEITVSSENSGKLLMFNIEEGQNLTKDLFIGYIDTIPLSLKREQIVISKAVLNSKSKGVLSQISVLNAQMATAKKKSKSH